MPNRYCQEKSIIRHPHGLKFRKALLHAFQETGALCTFVTNLLGSGIANQVMWTGRMVNDAFDVCRVCDLHRVIGTVLEALKECQPTNPELDNLILEMVRDKCLRDGERPAEPQHDWAQMHTSDRRELDETARALVALQVEECYLTHDAFTGFVMEALPKGLAERCAADARRYGSIEDAARKVLETCTQAELLTAFLAALCYSRPSNKYFKRCLEFMTRP